ncbi:hypothetical protein [Microbispora bryophytorum]|uniref:hypothetical protein n=1 Tax=Microbispora bryophytorum TaxID=1460882 RepID=UPI0033C44F6E
MQELVIGVVSSLLATALTVAAGWFGLSWPRRILLRLLSRMTGVGVVRSYATQSAANAELVGDLRSARWVRVVAGRGNELTRDSFQELWRSGGARLESVKVLLPDPADPGGWLRAREEEMRRADPGFEAGLLAKQVSANLDYLTAVAARRPQVDVRVFDSPHSLRAIITDRVAYFTPYLPGRHGRNSPCLVFAEGGVMYDHVLRVFDQLWQASPDRKPPSDRDGR